MELNKASKAIVRQWIDDKRVALVNQIVALQAQVVTFNKMLAELEEVAPTVVVDAAPPVPRGPRGPYKRGQHTMKEAALLALDAASPGGLTAQEVADLAQVPKTTASARLTLMKQEGLIRHVSPRYFAVHSKQQDNNMDQGAS